MNKFFPCDSHTRDDSLTRDTLTQAPVLSRTVTVSTAVLILILAAGVWFEFQRESIVTESDQVDPSMVDTSAIDPQLLHLLRHPLKETGATESAVNPEVALPIRINFPVSVARPAKTSYSFGTAMGGPDEPVVYTLNGEKITVDEFYVFRKQLALENYNNQLLMWKLRHEQREKMLESIVSTTDLGSHFDSDRWLQKNTDNLFVNLNGEQILALAKASEVSGLKIFHAPENNPSSAPSNESNPALGSVVTDSVAKKFPIDIVLLLSALVLAYLMTFYSLRNLRT